jgi:hypothetical protein
MESHSITHTREEQQSLLVPHEYTREVLSVRRHQDCVSCGHRTEFTCIKCGYCYSCHWRSEQVEAVELRDRLKEYYLLLSKGSDVNDKQKPWLKQDEIKDQSSGKWRTLDVLGQPAEPICNYYGCHHKFSLHGSRKCRCKHPTNKTLGLEVRYL